MSNRRKLKPPKKPKPTNVAGRSPEIITLRDSAAAIGNRIKAEIDGVPDPDLYYPRIIVAENGGQLLNNDINLHISYRERRAVPPSTPEQPPNE